MRWVRWLHIPTVILKHGGRIPLINYWMHKMQNVKQTVVHTAVPLKPEHYASEVERANEKLKGYVYKQWTNKGRTVCNNRMYNGNVLYQFENFRQQ